MRILAWTLMAALVIAPFASAHLFNTGTRHEDCQIYGDPDADFIGDGHTHTHDPVAGASLHNHDPCKQIGMSYPNVVNQGPIEEISLADAVLGDGDANNTEVIYDRKEAFRFPVHNDDIHTQTSLSVSGDAAAAGMGFPGAGTPSDPYIVEGYVVKNLLEIKDTSKCFVVRNNFVQSEGIIGPLIDPNDIVDLSTLKPYYDALNALANATLANATAIIASWDAARAPWDADKVVWDAEKATFESQEAQWQADFEYYRNQYLSFVNQEESLADSFEQYAAEWASLTGPAKTHQQYVQDLDQMAPVFESYLTGVSSFIQNNPPPTPPPPGSGWDQEGWDGYRDQYLSYVDSAQYHMGVYWNQIIPLKPDQAAYDAFVAEYDAFMAGFDAFIADYDAFAVDYNAAVGPAQAQVAQAQAQLQEVSVYRAKAAQYELEFTGTVKYVGGTVVMLTDSVEELVDRILELVLSQLRPNANTGRLVLDWNGQCIHAYHNVVQDLRVNQNNARTGWATGGVLEDNRFYTIGQIRHYDGDFRQNEVGNRDHLKCLVTPGMACPLDRSINNDGANEGWFRENLIYGQVDLDFHGHHHSPGFFAPESHYHGNTQTLVYMTNPDGSFMLDTQGNKIPHHDHAKRWTSVRFEDNVVINPKGVGLRFEDQQHRQDDEQANSENLALLKRPHLHRTEVRLENNIVVAPMFVDVFNADGVWLWNDTWTEPKTDLVGRITDALAHFGAGIENSHRERNDGWIDVQGNTQFILGGGTGIRIQQAKEANLVEIKDNQGFVLGNGFQSGLTASELLAFFRDAASVSPASTWSTVASWGGTRTAATAILLQNIKDSNFEVCGNQFRGFTKGFQATSQVYDDVTITACPTNNYGAADPAVSITYSPYPPAPPSCTATLRPLTDPTQAKYILAPVYDTLDGVTALCVQLPQEPVNLPPVPSTPLGSPSPPPSISPMPSPLPSPVPSVPVPSVPVPTAPLPSPSAPRVL